MRYSLILLLVIFTVQITKAQLANPNNIGSVKGILRDTANDYTLKSATVSLFRADSTLVNYQLSNSYGEFTFRNIPLNAKMYIEVSHVGYALYKKWFTVMDAKTPLDLKILTMNRRDVTLKEVEIKIPPISMNGDTLEFNAAAFKLDSNAVVEDLLRKIPNVTLWGDGQITVNGREVKSLLVNGKQFFGGDFKMATQNIPKSSLEKVQVYATRDENNPLDSTMNVNLKLKKGREIGYFGKIGAGYGTRNSYEIDANVNAFTPKMQLGIIGASNNINKIANSIQTLTANSTFKGVGTKVEYQSDFRQTGLNKPNVGGATFTYNFVEKPDYRKKSTLTANYFIQNRNTENITDTRTTTNINGSGQIFDLNVNNSNNIGTNQKFDSGFELVKKQHRLNIRQAMTVNDGNTTNHIERSAYNSQNVLTSTNNTVGNNDFKNKGLTLNIDYNLSPNYVVQRKHRFSGLQAKYDLLINDNESNRSNLTSFRLISNAASNKDFDRRYQVQNNEINQTLDLKLPNLKSLFFGYQDFAGFDLSLTNKLSLEHDEDDHQVEDLNATTNSYLKNAYLTNVTQVNVVDEIPGVTLIKSIYKSLANRYSKNLTIDLSAKQRFIHQANQSTQAIQNITRNYSRFVPSAGINFSHNQFGDFYKGLSINYNTNIRIPTLEQLAPLRDSTNLYYVQAGNINLRAATERELSFSFNHLDQGNKNVLNYNLYVMMGISENKIVDSIFIDDQNRRTVFLSNANGNKYLNANGNIRKTFKFKTTELQVSLFGGVNVAKNPGYVNRVFSFSNSLNTNGTLKFNFTYKDKFATEASQNYNTYHSKQAAFNTNYSGLNLASAVSSSYNFSKKLTLGSNISYNTSKSSNAKTINYTIWNASATYRFLKGNNAEFKLSALDLLHQNTNIINYGNANSYTLGTQQVLQQYFLTTFSYYPRKFGKTGVKK
jgi:hypothetical protein